MTEPVPPTEYGQLVDIGGRHLCARVRGFGSPVVVFESGAGSPSFLWALVEDLLVDRATTIAYDRAGLGWSDPAPGPRTSSAIADDLGALLSALALPPPYVLVGHSIAGLHVRAFQAARPDDVAGIVFLDAADAHVYGNVAATLGLHLRVLWRVSSRLGALASPRVAARLDLVGARTAFWRGCNRLLGTRAEAVALPASTVQVASLPDLGDLPVVVVPAGDLRDGFAGFADEWRAAQARLAALSTASVTVPGEGAGHFVHLERPDVVANAIAQLVAGSRRG